jgi:hypothetical protein
MHEVPRLPRITAVDVIGDHALRLTFDDGIVGDVAFDDAEWPGVLAPLRDSGFFAQVFIDFGTLAWPGELDLAPEPLYEAAKANPVVPSPVR